MQLNRDDLLMLHQEAKRQLMMYELSLVKFEAQSEVPQDEQEKVERKIRRLRIVMFELETEYAKA